MTKIVLIGTAKHNLGLDAVKFSIDGRVYEYDLNRNLLGRVSRLARFRPGEALNLAKKHGILQKGKTI